MIDALQNLEPVYSKWESKNPHVQNGKVPSDSGHSNGYNSVVAKGRDAWQSRFGNTSAPPPPRRTGRHSHGNKNKDNILVDIHLNHMLGASFKTAPSCHPKVGRLRPYAGSCCDCMPDSKNYLVTDSIKTSGVTNVLHVNASISENDWLSHNFSHIVFVMRRRLEHKYPDVTVAVLTSPRLLEAIRVTVQEETGNADPSKISSVERKHKSRAWYILEKMGARISNKLIRFTGWFLHKLFGRLLSSILIHKGQMTVLQQFCKKEVPVIFLPTHRSHLDYILLTFVLFNYDIKAPYVAAGDNLLIPFFGSLMRGLGGFFIRRKLDKSSKKRDHIYRAILNTYMEELLRNNEYLEFFVEGGRTRSGKPVYPKGGLLSLVVDAYSNGVIPEAYLVPVSISYDKLVDGNFVKEQMGEPKVYETFWRAVMAIYKVLMGRYGMVRMDFAQPFSLKEYLKVATNYPSSLADGLSEKLPGSSEIDAYSSDSMTVEKRSQILKQSLSSSSVDQEGKEMRHIVQCLAEHVVYASVSVQSILSTHLLAFVLLNEYRQGADQRVVITMFEWLNSEILMRDHDVSFTGDTEVVLEHALTLLGDRLVRKVTTKNGENEVCTRLIPTTTLPSVFELSYYANVISPMFATESVIANAIYSIVDFEEWMEITSASQIVVSQRKMMKEAMMLCSILKYEFIFCPPCQTLDKALKSAFDRLRNCSILMTDEVITKGGGINVQELMWAKRFAKHLHPDEQDSDSDSEWVTRNETCVVSREPDIMRKFWFFKRVLSPVLETYYVASCHLIQLLEHDVLETEFVKTVHTMLKERVAKGTASFAESVAMDTLKNAVRGFENAGVIHTYHEAGIAMIGLTESYQSDESLFTFIRRLESYRE